MYHHHHHHHGNHHGNRQEVTTTIVNPDGTTTVVKRTRGYDPNNPHLPIGFYVGLAGAMCVAYPGMKKYYEESIENSISSPLGPGVTVFSMTVCLNVPDRNDPTSILTKLHNIAETSNTATRQGVQSLMAETTVELARQEKSIVSVVSHYEHMNSPIEAQRQYNNLSVQQRSTFYREDVSNYGGQQKLRKSNDTGGDDDDDDDDGKYPTIALVNIHLAIEGNSLKHFGKISNRKGLKDALAQISSDVQVEDCLLAAEVIWSPEDSKEQITMKDIYEDFPSLQTLLN
jgi:uncharacterized membrane protein